MFLTPNSVEYLRPDIEYKSLSQSNILECTLGSDVQLYSVEQKPIATSTGNGIIRVEGWLRAIFAISVGQEICTLPSLYLPHKIYVFNGVRVDSGTGDFETLILFFNNMTGEIVSRGPSTINANDVIILDGITYFQKFSK